MFAKKVLKLSFRVKSNLNTYCSNNLDFLFKAKVPTKRVRIGKTPPLEKAVETEPEPDEEAYQISDGKVGLMEGGSENSEIQGGGRGVSLNND